MTKCNFYTSSREINKLFCELVNRSEEIYISVAWATSNHEAFDILKQNKTKVKRFFCGIERNLTSPEVIESFLDTEAFRIVDDTELFHHKAYIFKYKNEKEGRGKGLITWETMIGSSNFTSSGFNKNFELVQHTVFDNLIDIHEQIEKDFISKSIRPDQKFLEKYKLDFAESQKKEASKQKIRKHQTTKFFRLSWEQYVESIKLDPQKSLEGRLKLLESYKTLLNNASFDQLNVEDRKKIAGTYSGEDNELEDFDSRWFGGMSGAGKFNHNVISEPKLIADAIERIPKHGIVTRKNFDEFMEKMIPASGYEGGDPLAVSTRILAMVRPDYFFCKTSQNLSGLANDLSFTKTTLNISNYWELVVEPLIDSDWWQVRDFESENERRIWNSRVAILDILYYKPKEK